jgi:hypothetical protein
LIAVNTQKKTGNKIWVTNTTHWDARPRWTIF